MNSRIDIHTCMYACKVLLCFASPGLDWTGLDWTGMDFPAVIMNRLRSALTKGEISTDV